MNRKSIYLAALVAGTLSVASFAQVSPAPPQTAAPAAAVPATQPPVQPQAVPAKIALIAFEQAVVTTNEGQTAMAAIQKKYEPKQAQLESLNKEIDSLNKQLQAAPATLSEEERSSRLRTIDTKQKQLTRDTEDARTSYQSDLQEAYGKVAQKFDGVMKKYVADKGFTLLLNVDVQQSPVMWAVQETDVTEAVIAAYNTSSGVAAPPPSAPSANRPKPAAPRPATPKPPAK